MMKDHSTDHNEGHGGIDKDPHDSMVRASVDSSFELYKGTWGSGQYIGKIATDVHPV